MDSWHVALNGVQQGPFSQAQIQQEATGMYTQDTLVWHQGFAN